MILKMIRLVILIKKENINKGLKILKKKLTNRTETSRNTRIYEHYTNTLKRILFTKKSSGRGLTISSLLIPLSKIYTNNSSKELINDIEQLINNLYDNKQITKQVYNNLNKAITYVQSTNVYDIYKNDSQGQNKILDDKTKANERQYNLDRMNAEISAYSSGDLPKYKYLTKKV